ncbi:alpha-(1,6)-fucosyltransferase isoform X1 [Hydra vulgaris]|uniref:alpha-(1,6)-fucosyltransferase isoform X1 n=1 Tax=Hydra vulgaris TaxID=6087 RepID=UPI001F5E9D04|nr:alpha-(1,6)-fucosyltransferase [Hydra vulgaris]
MLWRIFTRFGSRIMRLLTTRSCFLFATIFFLYHVLLLPYLLKLFYDQPIESNPQFMKLFKKTKQLKVENVLLQKEMQKNYKDEKFRLFDAETKARELALFIENLKLNNNVSFFENNSQTNWKRNGNDLLLYADSIKNKIETIKAHEAKIANSVSLAPRSANFEVLSRRISNQIEEMWFLWRGNLKKIQDVLKNHKIPSGFLNKISDEFREINQITERDYEELMAIDGIKEYKKNLANNLSNKIQNRIFKLQHPSSCYNAKKLVLNLNKPCGYGCQMHHLIYGMIVAYATKRILVISDTNIGSDTNLNLYYQKLTNCSLSSKQIIAHWGENIKNKKVVSLPPVEFIRPRPKQMPMAVPNDIIDTLKAFHSRPFIWWVGQICKFLFRQQPFLSDKLFKKKKELKFKNPIVGIHVRRTDKKLEAAYHNLEEYMYWVDLYYKKRELSGSLSPRRVFIASDDTLIIKEAREKYPKYIFIHDEMASEYADVNQRFSKSSIEGIISDVELLSECDFLVCTFSSQVCRLAYEFMNHKHTDASKNVRSLDDIYYFGGQKEHAMKVIWPNIKTSNDELKLDIGDTIKIAGNHWDGKSIGKNLLTQEVGSFFSYKAEDIINVENFLTNLD